MDNLPGIFGNPVVSLRPKRKSKDFVHGGRLRISGLRCYLQVKTAKGVVIVKKCIHEMIYVQGMTWDMPNILIGTKEHKSRVYGTDYYQCLSRWVIPAAIKGHNLEEFVGNDSLVKGIINASRSD